MVVHDPNDVAFADDEDVAAEALRVGRMGGVLGEGEGEVVLRGLRKVYRTQQASKKEEVSPSAEGPIVRLDVFLSRHTSYDASQPSCH